MVTEADEKKRRGEKRPDPPPPSAPGTNKRQEHAASSSHRPLAAATASEPTTPSESPLRPQKGGAAMGQQPNQQFMLYSSMPATPSATSHAPASRSPQKSQGTGMILQQPQHTQAQPQLQPPAQAQAQTHGQQMSLPPQGQGRAQGHPAQLPPQQQSQPPLHHPIAHATTPQAMSPRMPSLRNPSQPYVYASEREREQPVTAPQPVRVAQAPGGIPPASDPMQQRPVTTSAPPMAHQAEQHGRLMDQRQSIQLKQEPDMSAPTPYDYAGHPGARGLQARPEPSQLPRSRPRSPVAGDPGAHTGAVRNRMDRMMSDTHAPPPPMAAPRPVTATPLDRFGSVSGPAAAPSAPQPPATPTPAPPAPKPAEPKKSSLMALLNDDPQPAPPAQPAPVSSAPPQRVSEGFTLAPTPQPQGMAARAPPPPPQPPQPRREPEPTGYAYARNAPGPASGMAPMSSYASPQPQPQSVQRSSIVTQQHEPTGATERDYYRQHPYAAQHAAAAMGSPQTGPHHGPPHSQPPQYAPQVSYGQYPPRPAAASPPPPQYAMHMQGSRPRDVPPRESWTPAPPSHVPQSPAPPPSGVQQPGWPVTQGPPAPPTTTQPPPQQASWAGQPHSGGSAWSQQHAMPLRDERQASIYGRPQHAMPPQAAHGRMQGQYPPTPSRDPYQHQHYGSPTTQVVHDPREMGRSYTPVAAYDARAAPPPGHAHTGSVGHMGHVHGYMQDPREMQMDPRERERRGN